MTNFEPALAQGVAQTLALTTMHEQFHPLMSVAMADFDRLVAQITAQTVLLGFDEMQHLIKIQTCPPTHISHAD